MSAWLTVIIFLVCLMAIKQKQLIFLIGLMTVMVASFESHPTVQQTMDTVLSLLILTCWKDFLFVPPVYSLPGEVTPLNIDYQLSIQLLGTHAMNCPRGENVLSLFPFQACVIASDEPTCRTQCYYSRLTTIC